MISVLTTAAVSDHTKSKVALHNPNSGEESNEESSTEHSDLKIRRDPWLVSTTFEMIVSLSKKL